MPEGVRGAGADVRANSDMRAIIARCEARQRARPGHVFVRCYAGARIPAQRHTGNHPREASIFPRRAGERAYRMKIRAHLEVETGLPLGVDLLGPKQQMCRLRWPRRLVHERISDHEQCERNEERGGRAHEGDEGATPWGRARVFGQTPLPVMAVWLVSTFPPLPPPPPSGRRFPPSVPDRIAHRRRRRAGLLEVG